MKATGIIDQNFTQHLNNFKLIADKLPAALIIHTLQDLDVVYMNEMGTKILGTTLEELQRIDADNYQKKHFNTDSNGYIPRLLHLLKTNSAEFVSYFQEVRTPFTDSWQLYLSNTKVFYRNQKNEPTHIITIASRLDPEHDITTKVTRLVEEISFFKKNNPLFLTLTKREKEILKCIALGMNSGEIAEKLFISSATADTHRRNLRNKLGLKNIYDTMKFAQAYDLI